MDEFTQMITTSPAEPPNGNYKYVPLPEMDGRQLRANYSNGYGASVIQHKYSYGGDKGLFELAVTHPEALCYASGITNDVIGYLSQEDVVITLHKIAALKPNENCDHKAKWGTEDDFMEDSMKNLKNPELLEFIEDNSWADPFGSARKQLKEKL